MKSFIDELRSENFFADLTAEDRKNAIRILPLILFLLAIVPLWDRFQLGLPLTPGYVLVKGATISIVALTIYFIRNNTKSGLWIFLTCLSLLVYSYYGLVYSDFTYCYSFLEMYLGISFFFRISKKSFLTLMGFGAVLNITGLIIAAEPPFVKDGFSFKPHIGIVTFIFYFLSFILFFRVTKRNEQLYALQEKFAKIGKQSSYIFHEMKKPISRLMKDNSSNQNDIQSINNIFLNIDLMLKDPQSFKNSFVPFNLKTTFEKLDLEFHQHFSEFNITFNYPKEDLFVNANEALIYQVFKNLIVNAVEAIIKNDATNMNEFINVNYDARSIQFKNTGSFISHADKETVFDPFYTTKSSGTNHGLGLSFCKNIIEGHSGTIQTRPEKDAAIFIITL